MKYRFAPIFALPAVLACEPVDALPHVDSGALTICTDATATDGVNDFDVNVSGIVVAVDEGEGECVRSVTVEEGDGTAHTFGWALADADGADVTEPFDLEVGDQVDVRYRYRVVWGDVTGLIIEDDAGLVFAADEGGWGSALADETVEGLSVSRGSEVVAETPGDCEPLLGYEVEFDADDSLTLTPFEAGDVQVSGSMMVAYAVRATEWGTSSNCDASDTSDYTTWAVAR